VTEWPFAAATDGSRVALLSRFVPSNLVCGLEQKHVIVRDVESGKALWSARWTGPVPSRTERPTLDQLVPADVRARHALVSPARAVLSFPDVAHRSARGANDRVARGIRADGGPFEVALPVVSDTLQEAWILDDRLLLVFAVSESTPRGERDTFAFVSLPIRAQSSPAEYEALRARVVAAPSAIQALRLIADEAYRDAANPFMAAALVGQLSPPPMADDAPEAYLAAVADLTLYLSKMKEAGAGCVDIATAPSRTPASARPRSPRSGAPSSTTSGHAGGTRTRPPGDPARRSRLVVHAELLRARGTSLGELELGSTPPGRRAAGVHSRRRALRPSPYRFGATSTISSASARPTFLPK
jgi:hypothetical protein